MKSHMTGTIRWGCFNMGSFCCHERRPLLHWLCHGIGPRIALRPDEQWPQWMPMVFLVTRNTWRIDQNMEKNKGKHRECQQRGQRGSESL